MRTVILGLILLVLVNSCATLNSLRCDYAKVNGVQSHNNGFTTCEGSK